VTLKERTESWWTQWLFTGIAPALWKRAFIEVVFWFSPPSPELTGVTFKPIWAHPIVRGWMVPGACTVITLFVLIALVLAAAVAWGPHHCKPVFPMVVGCAIGNYESLAGGLIAAASALVAGWIAWRAVQFQIDAEQRRAIADRVEVEDVLQADIDNLAEGLGALWRILETHFQNHASTQTTEGVIDGINLIAKPTWIKTSRLMAQTLGWERRLRYDELFNDLEELSRRFNDPHTFDLQEALAVVKRISIDFEIVRPETHHYFEGLHPGSPKAWTLGYTIQRMVGIDLMGSTIINRRAVGASTLAVPRVPASH
jgi:hypothetical protein